MKKLNEHGQLTMDFLFAATLILGVSALLGALTIALTLTEVLQYITYSAARSYMSGDGFPGEQTREGNEKAQTLLKKLPFLAGAQRNGWIVPARDAGQGAKDYDNYREALQIPAKRSQFVGYQIDFTLPILGLKLPLLGKALESPDGPDFKGRVSSFLLREPSTEECMYYLQSVYQALIRTNPAFQRVTTSPGVTVDPNGFSPIVDNGC